MTLAVGGMLNTYIKTFIYGTDRPMTLVLVCGPYQVFSVNDIRLTLTYFMAMSNLIPNAFFFCGEKS